MCSRSNLRTVAGVLVLVVLTVSPASAAATTERPGWVEILEVWWDGLVQQLVTGASKADDGPSIDPAGASASGGQETDDGPTIDPGG